MRAVPLANNTRLLWLLVVPILLFAAWQGARWLSDDLIWADEQYSLWVTGGAHYGPLSPAEIFDRTIIDTGHPPNYYMLLAAWGAFAGWSEVTVRTLSWLLGLLAIAWTYRLGCDAVSRLVGVIAALALGANLYFHNYMHDARMYSLFASVTVICLWLYWRIVSVRGSGRTQIAFTLSVITALYTHYMALPMLAILGLYHVLSYLWTAPERRGLWWRLLAGLIIGAMTFLPWGLGPFRQNSSAESMAWRGGTDIGTAELLAIVPHLFANRGWPLVLLIGAFVLLEFLRPARRSLIGFLLFWTGGTLLLITLLNAVRPFVLSYRYVLMLWPAAAVLVGIGVSRMAQTQRFGRALAVIMLVVWVALIFLREGPIDPPLWRGAQVTLDTLERQATAQDAAVFYWSKPFDFNDNVLAHYTDAHNLDVPSAIIDFQLGRVNAGDVTIDQNRYQQNAEAFMNNAPFVWLVLGTGLEPAPYLTVFEDTLDNLDYHLCGMVVDHPDMRLLLYRHENAVGERGFTCSV